MVLKGAYITAFEEEKYLYILQHWFRLRVQKSTACWKVLESIDKKEIQEKLITSSIRKKATFYN